MTQWVVLARRWVSLLAVFVLGLAPLTFASPAIDGKDDTIVARDRLIGTWVGYSTDTAEPQMAVVFSRSGWMTKTYFGTPRHTEKCRYTYTVGHGIKTRCVDRGLRVHAIDRDTIEFLVTDSQRVESIDLIYSLTFRRASREAQPN